MVCVEGPFFGGGKNGRINKMKNNAMGFIPSSGFLLLMVLEEHAWFAYIYIKV
jgi:hypothetical protein